MWYTLLFTVLCGALTVQGQGLGQNWADDLGSQIQAQVANQISATNAHIQSQIQSQLQSQFPNYHQPPQPQVRSPYTNYDLGSQIQALVANYISATNAHIQSQIQSQLQSQFPNYHQPAQPQVQINDRVGTGGLSSLDNLGDIITQNVNQQLEPVRAITPNLNIRNGVGGTTIVSYQPGGKQFIKKSNKMWSCSGSINVHTGECNGVLSPFSVSDSSPKTDWCYVNSYSIVNNHICLSTGGISVSSINGHSSCTSQTNPYIMLTLDEYKTMCSGLSSTIKYIYIPDLKDPNHVEIPNSNKYVTCDNNQQNYCIVTEDNPALNSNGGSVIIQNGEGSVGQTYISNGQGTIQSAQSIVYS